MWTRPKKEKKDKGRAWWGEGTRFDFRNQFLDGAVKRNGSRLKQKLGFNQNGRRRSGSRAAKELSRGVWGGIIRRRVHLQFLPELLERRSLRKEGTLSAAERKGGGQGGEKRGPAEIACRGEGSGTPPARKSNRKEEGEGPVR